MNPLTKQYPHISAKIIEDSRHPSGSRLTTFELTYPRYIHAEIMTHRQLSRNAQSSRAIPVKRRLERVRKNPVTPIYWGANQRGMQAKQEEVEAPMVCEGLWEEAGAQAADYASTLMEQGLHKQWANRLLEPFDTITVIVTGTEWSNLFGLRCHPDAQPEFQYLAWMMADLYYWHSLDSIRLRTHGEVRENLERVVEARMPWLEAPRLPRLLAIGEWHLPYVSADEQHAAMISIDTAEDEAANNLQLAKLSVARCARVSYLNHDGSTPDHAKDIALHDRLLDDGHMSPFEHQAMVPDFRSPDYRPDPRRAGNFATGWVQYRKILDKPEVRRFDYVAAMQKYRLQSP